MLRSALLVAIAGLLVLFSVESSSQDKKEPISQCPPVSREEAGGVEIDSDTNCRIIVPKGKKIIFKITELQLNSPSILLISDGKSGQSVVFKTDRSERIRKYPNNRVAEFEYVDLPFEMETVTRKLFIGTSSFSGTARMTAQYASFSEEGACRKSDLTEEGEKTFVSDYPLSPVATSCGVVKSCPENRQQMNTEMTCTEGLWTGNVSCKLIPDLIDSHCNYSSEISQMPDQCPYSAQEIVEFYADVDGYWSEDLGRSGRARVKCGAACKSRLYCKKGRKQYCECLLCRVVHRCSRRTVFFQ